MAKKEILNFHFSDIPYRAYAIHTTLPLHLFAWHTDTLIDTSFTLEEPFETEIKKIPSQHRRFIHRPKDSSFRAWILENKGKSYLFQSKPAADFLLILKDGEEEDFLPDLKNVMKNIAGVSIVYPVNEMEKNKLYWVADLMFEEDNKNNNTLKKPD